MQPRGLCIYNNLGPTSFMFNDVLLKRLANIYYDPGVENAGNNTYWESL